VPVNSGGDARGSERKLLRKGVGVGGFAWRGRYGEGRALLDKIPPPAPGEWPASWPRSVEHG